MAEFVYDGLAYPTLIKGICLGCSGTMVLKARPKENAVKEFRIGREVEDPTKDEVNVQYHSLCSCFSCGKSIWVNSLSLHTYAESLNHNETFEELGGTAIEQLKIAVLCKRCKKIGQEVNMLHEFIIGDMFTYRNPIPHPIPQFSSLLPMHAFSYLKQERPKGLDRDRIELSRFKGKTGKITAVAFMGWRQVEFDESKFFTFLHVTELKRPRKEK